jgi:lambda family phage portal protein
MAFFDFLRTKQQPKHMKRSYYGAETGRLFSDFITQSLSADSEISPSLRILRDRCRELSRNDPYAKRYIQILNSNVVGSAGVRLQVRKRNTDGSLDTPGNRIVETAWAAWGRKDSCSIDGRMSWNQCQRLFIETLARDGEVLIRKIKNPAGNRFGFSLQFIEADYLDENYNNTAPSGNEVRMGVEITKEGKPVAYWLFEDNPNHTNGFGRNTSARKRIRVPAEEIIHSFIQERAGQTRGVPMMANVLGRLKMLDGFEEASLVHARVAASKMGFFTSPSGDEFVGDDYQGAAPLMDASPGTFSQLPDGMSFESFDPSGVGGADFADFEKAILRGIASGLGVSYVSLSNNLEGVSYSSIRQGTMEDRDNFKMLQQFMIENFVDEVYRSWLEQAITYNAVTLPMAKYDLFADQVTYRPRGYPAIDPQKEVNANIAAINSGIMTLQDVHGQHGRDTEEVFEQVAREKDLAARYEIETAFQPFGNKLPAAPSVEGGDDGEL